MHPPQGRSDGSSGSYDTLIIGAGMSGLAAAIRLAQYDQRVLVPTEQLTPLLDDVAHHP